MSAEPLPPFSGDHPPCVKCGSRNADTQYVPPQEEATDAEGWIVADAAPEFLLRTCARCSYCWPEACIPSTVERK